MVPTTTSWSPIMIGEGFRSLLSKTYWDWDPFTFLTDS